MLSEILPFWSLALVGLAASTGAVSLAGNIATSVSTTRSTQTMVIAAAALLAYGLVWILRFAVLDRYVFTPSSQ
jgi:predicted methyltransferase MtxX (methanogen marker protein 4)